VTSICVVVRVVGLTIDAPSVGLPTFYDPSVYIKSQGFQATWNWRIGYLLWLGVCGFISGYGYVYDWLLSMCCESSIVRLREMCGGFVPTIFVNASWRVRRIVGCSNVESAFSFVTR
jgi:hypothetical protein